MPNRAGTTQTAGRRGKRIFLGGVVALLALSGSGKRGAAIEPGDAHDLYALVERGKKPVAGLLPQNFRLYMDDQLRPFRLEPSETPANVVFVIENSDVSTWYRNEIQAAMQELADHGPQGNWYALVTFARDVEVTTDFTRNKAAVASAYDGAAQAGGSEISTFDAAFRVLKDLDRIRGRRVVVFIGSGLDRYSERSLKDVEKALEASDVTVYAIGTGALLRQPYEPYMFPGMRMELMQARGVLETLAGDSGGKAWFPDSDSGFADALKGVFNDMASQYRLVDEGQLPADGKLHKIKLKVVGFEGGEQVAYDVRVRKGWRSG